MLAKLIRRKREEEGLSLRDISVPAGLNHSVVNRIERGINKPDLLTAIKILVLGLHMDIDDEEAQRSINEVLKESGVQNIKITKKKK